MRIYLAARYERQPEMRQRRDELQQIGHEVVSTWIDKEVGPGPWDHWIMRTAAEIDRTDLGRADFLILFSEEASFPRGSRHVETGIALARGTQVYIVGPRENVFHFLPEVEVFATWAECLAVFKSPTHGSFR